MIEFDSGFIGQLSMPGNDGCINLGGKNGAVTVDKLLQPVVTVRPFTLSVQSGRSQNDREQTARQTIHRRADNPPLVHSDPTSGPDIFAQAPAIPA